MRLKRFRTDYKTTQEIGRDLYDILNEENTYTVTLGTGTSLTSVTNQFVGLNSVVAMMPTSATAAIENYYIVTAKKSFDIHHSTATAADRTYRFHIYG